MATDRFAAWVTQTKGIISEGAANNAVTYVADLPSPVYFYIAKAVVFALLTIAIAIHEAAEIKKGK
jgi:hypothetical protein